MIKNFDSVGDFLTKILAITPDASQESLAADLNMSRTSLSRLIAGDVDLSLKNALNLERYTGIDAQEWMTLDLSRAIAKARDKEQIFEKDTVNKINIFIDSENILPTHLRQLSRLSNYKLWLLYNAKDSSNYRRISEYLAYKDVMETVSVCRKAKNAMDFHITYLIGRLLATKPNSQCYIVSRDRGFDPLCQHIQSNGSVCKRITRFTELPVTNPFYAHRAKELSEKLKERSVRMSEKAKLVEETRLEELKKKKEAKKEQIKRQKENSKDFVGEDIRKVCLNLSSRFHHNNPPLNRFILLTTIGAIKGLLNSVESIVEEMLSLGLITLSGDQKVEYRKREITYYSLYGRLPVKSFVDDLSVDVCSQENIIVNTTACGDSKASGRKNVNFFKVVSSKPSAASVKA